MKQLFSIVLFIFMFAGISTVTLAGDVIEKQSFETVDVEFEQSNFEFIALEVVKKPPIFIDLVAVDFYKNYNAIKSESFKVVDVGKINDCSINYTYKNTLRSHFINPSNLEIVNARSRLTCKSLNLLV